MPAYWSRRAWSKVAHRRTRATASDATSPNARSRSGRAHHVGASTTTGSPNWAPVAAYPATTARIASDPTGSSTNPTRPSVSSTGNGDSNCNRVPVAQSPTTGWSDASSDPNGLPTASTLPASANGHGARSTRTRTTDRRTRDVTRLDAGPVRPCSYRRARGRRQSAGGATAHSATKARAQSHDPDRTKASRRAIECSPLTRFGAARPGVARLARPVPRRRVRMLDVEHVPGRSRAGRAADGTVPLVVWLYNRDG